MCGLISTKAVPTLSQHLKALFEFQIGCYILVYLIYLEIELDDDKEGSEGLANASREIVGKNHFHSGF